MRVNASKLLGLAVGCGLLAVVALGLGAVRRWRASSADAAAELAGLRTDLAGVRAELAQVRRAQAALGEHAATLEQRFQRAQPSEPGRAPSSDAQPREPGMVEAAAPSRAAVRPVQRWHAPATLDIVQDDAGSVSVQTRDPALAGQTIVVEAEYADGTRAPMVVVVPKA